MRDRACGKPSFDVIHLSYHVQKRQFEKAGWLANLSGYMKDPTLTAPDLVENDFSAAGLKYAKDDKGQLLSLPSLTRNEERVMKIRIAATTKK